MGQEQAFQNKNKRSQSISVEGGPLNTLKQQQQQQQQQNKEVKLGLYLKICSNATCYACGSTQVSNFKTLVTSKKSLHKNNRDSVGFVLQGLPTFEIIKTVYSKVLEVYNIFF